MFVFCVMCSAYIYKKQVLFKIHVVLAFIYMLRVETQLLFTSAEYVFLKYKHD